MLRSIIRHACLFLFFALITINAQTLNSYGLKIGAANSDPKWQIEQQWATATNFYYQGDTKTGIDAGIFAEWSLVEKLTLLTEVHYIQKGLIYSLPISITIDKIGDVGVNIERCNPSFNYLSFPVLAKYYLFDSGSGLYVLGGLRLDFILSKVNVDKPSWLYDNIKKNDYGAVIGFGIQTRSFLGIGTGLEIKYSPSFTKVSSTQMAEITNSSIDINFVLFY